MLEGYWKMIEGTGIRLQVEGPDKMWCLSLRIHHKE